MLLTVDEVVDALGGTAKSAELAGVRSPAVSNWRSRGRIPAEKSMIFAEALRALGYEADPRVFGLEPAEARP